MRIRKQIAAVLAAVLMFAMFVPVKAAESTDLIFLNYTNFTEMNGWSKDSAGLFGSYAAPMKSSLNGKSAVGLDACAYFSSAASGTYSVWIRCLYQGSEDRRFRIGFNTGVLPGFVSNLEADSSGSYEWKWQKAGEVYLKKGVVNQIRLMAYSSLYSRCDAILLAGDSGYVPPDTLSEIEKLESFQAENVDSSAYNGEEWKKDSYLYNFDSLFSNGTWQLYKWDEYTEDPFRRRFSDRILRGHQFLEKQPSKLEPAVINADIQKGGTYALWIRSMQFASKLPKQDRSFDISVNGEKKRVGKCVYDGYAWELAGEFELNDGLNRIELDDSNGNYARLDCLALTRDTTCQPPDFQDEAMDSFAYYNRTCESAYTEDFPAYAKNGSAAAESVKSIKNKNLEINFYNVSDETHRFVQNEVIYQGSSLKTREENFGRILCRNSAAEVSDSEIRESPFINVKSPKPFNTFDGDWVTDSAWGITPEHTWTNISASNPSGTYIPQSFTVRLNIPKSGHYYAITRGYAHSAGNPARGYTAAVDKKVLTSGGNVHYFNVTNSDTFGKFALSHNSDPIYLEAGDAEVTLTSFGAPMRTSMFALVPAENTEQVEEIEKELTSYSKAIERFGGGLPAAFSEDVPKSRTEFPYAVTYDYAAAANGGEYTRLTSNIYAMGSTQWLIPSSAEQTAVDVVTVCYENDFVTLTEIWKLSADAEEPQVDMTLTAKAGGNYSILIPSQGSYKNQDLDYLFLPMMYRGHGFYSSAIMLTQQFMFTPMVSVTLTRNGTPVTYGFAADPESVENRWVYKDDYEYAATLGTPSGDSEMKISPTLSAPAPGSEKCGLNAGDSYHFSYRPIYRTDDWYTTFSHVLTDLFEFRDYRRNYYNSVTDAVLNATDVMMDSQYSGWDDNSMAYWNMEGRNIASNAAPLEALQKFYLTDDKKILAKRTIPTIVNALTRSSHFRADDIAGGVDSYVGDKSTWPTAVGAASSFFGADVYGGFYEMSANTMETALSAAKASADKIKSSSSNGKDISRLVGMYRANGEAAYLEKARTVADNYLSALQNEIQSAKPLSENAQAYASYMPYIAGLMDIYDETGEQKYLDAAEYAGRVVLSLVWSPGPSSEDAEQDLTITKEYLKQKTVAAGQDFWWYGDKHFRVGNRGLTDSRADCDPQTRWDELQDETVPAWVPSRSGIGLEAPNTFYDESTSVIMASWAGDLMRLSALTGNVLFEAAARNAIVGRFGSYGGYSLNRFTTYPMKKDYLTDSPIDFSSVYWHHIPAFISMIEDFLISQAWNWSDRQIDFPHLRQEGYAYFNTNQYGFQPGRVFDEDNMWLWLDREVLSVTSGSNAENDRDDFQADWIAARKDGVMAAVFMNESRREITVTAKLGSKADPEYNGNVRLYVRNADGDFEIRYVHAENGAFEVTIGAHELVGAVIRSEKIKAPSYANTQYSNDGAVVSVKHNGNISGSGSIMQLTPEEYFAHIYITDKPSEQCGGIQVSYRFGDSAEEKTISDSVYPYEVLIQADGENVKKEIHYRVTVCDAEGNALKTSEEYTMKPYTSSGSVNGGDTAAVKYSQDEKNRSYTIRFNAEQNAWLNGQYDVITAVYDKDSRLVLPKIDAVTVEKGKNTSIKVAKPQVQDGFYKIFVWTKNAEPLIKAIEG